MAWMNQEKKAKIAARMKPVLKKYGVKATLAVRHHSKIVLNVAAGKIDFLENYRNVAKPEFNRDYINVNEYYLKDSFDGKAVEFLKEAFAALNLAGDENQNFDDSDSQTDYFNCGWYVDVNIGQYNKPYQVL